MKQEDDWGPRVRVVALSVGKVHFEKGNPGPEVNFSRLMELANASIRERPDIICFPEFAVTGSPYLSCEEVRSTGEPVPGDGPYYTRYVDLARRSEAVVCGWLIEKETASVYHNTSFLIDSRGSFIGRYRKVHPTASEEGQWWLAPGAEIPVFDLGFVRLGIAICWDMDFPEVCRSLMLGGAELVLHPTVVNDRRDICPVRCKENALPMVVCVYTDSSYAIDAQGLVVADMAGKGGYLVCDLYPQKAVMISKYGVLFNQHKMYLARRRPRAYGMLIDRDRTIPWIQAMRNPDGTPISEDEIRRQFPRLA